MNELNKPMNKCALLTVISITLLLSSCNGSRAASLDRVESSTTHRGQNASSLGTTPSPDAAFIMKKVADKYSKLRSYRSSGFGQRVSTFDGAERARFDEEFRVEYDRGRGASLQWNSANKAHRLTIDGSKAWLETDGALAKNYPSPRDGIHAAASTEDGFSRFLFNVYVFRDELGLKKGFFLGFRNPQVVGETEVDGHACYLLRGHFEPGEASMTYGIDKESFLIRSIEGLIVVRKTVNGKEYVSTTRMSETYTGVELE
jgi:hypothetical protein